MDKVIIFGSEMRGLYLRGLHLKYLLEAIPGAEVVDIEKGFCPDLSDCRVFVIGTQMFAGSAALNAVAERMRDCKFLVFVTDDYVFNLATQYRKAVEGKNNAIICSTPDILSHNARLKSWAWCKRMLYVRWQKASWAPMVRRQPTRPMGLLYYGIFREKREARFREYFKQDLYTLYLSGSDKARDKFWERGLCGGRVQEVDKIAVPGDLWEYPAALYIEDEAGIYTGVANRFYECVSQGVPLLIDVNSVPTFEREGLVCGPVVTGPWDVLRYMDQDTLRDVAETQYRLYGTRDFNKELRTEIQEAVCSL